MYKQAWIQIMRLFFLGQEMQFGTPLECFTCDQSFD